MFWCTKYCSILLWVNVLYFDEQVNIQTTSKIILRYCTWNRVISDLFPKCYSQYLFISEREKVRQFCMSCTDLTSRISAMKITNYTILLYICILSSAFGLLLLQFNNYVSYKQIQWNKAALSFAHNVKCKFKINSADIYLLMQKQTKYQHIDLHL